jgi:DNA-binding response OmpR family regulator
MSIQNFKSGEYSNPVLGLAPRILAIEPDPGIGEMLCELFNAMGYNCEVIRECDNIIQLMERYKPDVVLIEYLLTMVNGGELCNQIKSHPSYSGIPVIMYSAYPQLLWSVKDYGCDEFIAKPFDINDLVNKVERWIIKGKERRRFSFLADSLKNRINYLSKFLGQ